MRVPRAPVGAGAASRRGLTQAPYVPVGWLDRGAACSPDRSDGSHLSGLYLLSACPAGGEGRCRPSALEGVGILFLTWEV